MEEMLTHIIPHPISNLSTSLSFNPLCYYMVLERSLCYNLPICVHTTVGWEVTANKRLLCMFSGRYKCVH